MKRRELLKYFGGSSLASTMPGLQLWAAPQNFNGRFFVFIQANAGWDVTSFCDPKTNITGQSKINNWADKNSIKKAGNINYAPFANNTSFFENLHDRMLIINGINSSTNSHTAGRDYNFSGNIAQGYPSLSALYASVHNDGFAMPCIVNGGHFRSEGVVTPTIVGRNDATLTSLINPNARRYNHSSLALPQADYELAKQFQLRRAHDQVSNDLHLYKQAKSQQEFLAAVSNGGGFESFGELLQTVESGPFNLNEGFNKQALYAILGFKSGLSATADLVKFGFDTHDDHDTRHSMVLGGLTTGIECLWYLAEQLGIDDRLTVMVASDFSRTPKYNSNQGKDHWAIGSTIFMEKNARWANRVVGATDESHNLLKINPTTLAVDDENGIEITPAHVMQNARQLLGIANHPNTFPYGLETDQHIALFDV